jgi:hypothetical protein
MIGARQAIISAPKACSRAGGLLCTPAAAMIGGQVIVIDGAIP